MAWYVDTSAFLKLVVDEPESTALRAWMDTAPDLVSCDLLRTEAHRAARRLTQEAVARVRPALATISVGAVTTDCFERAGELDPAILRSLDAVHLAWALSLGDDLEGIVTYDERLASAASVYGIAVLAPA